MEEIKWNKLHNFKNGEDCSCTSLSTYENDFATIGEDGNIHFLTSQRKNAIRTIG